MNILVIGCDQVGAALIRDLERIGHDISVVEKDPEQLKRLDAFDDYTFHGTALVGDPTDPEVFIGPLIDEAHCPFVQGQIDDAVAQGARVIAGGVKESGVGRECGRCSMDDYTELKWLTFQTKGRW